MQIETEQTVRNINQRCGWRNTRKLLGSSLGVTALGLDPFIERLKEAVRTDSSLENIISNFWKDLVFSGERLITLYRLDEQEMANVQNAMSTLSPDQSDFVRSYPTPLSKEELLACDTSLHFAETRTDLINEKQVETSIFLSKAFYTQIIELDATHLSDAGIELKANGGEIKCKTREVTQCYNSVMLIPSENLLVLTVDLSVLPRSESGHQKFLVEQFVRNSAKIHLARPIELFPAIQDMYEKVDGRISQMSFLTADGNSSALKLKPSQQCLRADTYHHGGESASPILTKFKLGKIWDISQSASQTLSVELTLPGKRTMLDNPKQHLFEAILSNCNSIETVVFIINKLLKSIQSIEQSAS